LTPSKAAQRIKAKSTDLLRPAVKAGEVKAFA
jgi:hypothetical protein